MTYIANMSTETEMRTEHRELFPLREHCAGNRLATVDARA